jgi:quercetin dioxygenase-like cupin family protein
VGESTLGAYYRHDQEDPDVRGDRTEHWYAPAVNFVVETIHGQVGATCAVTDPNDEHLVLLPEGSAELSVSAGGTRKPARPGSLVVVPPGESAIEFLDEGYAYRVFSALSPIHAETRRFGRLAEGAPVKPLSPGAPPPGGYALRVYDFADHPVQRPKRVFRSVNLMAVFLGPMPLPRGDRLSPHFHEDFEQASVVTQGTYVHHIRRTWGTDAAAWRDDDHERVGAPSVTVIPPPDIHTSQTVETGPFQHVDIFAPPRADLVASGDVLNADDYPGGPE